MITQQRILVTPEIAEEWLASNFSNRLPKLTSIGKYTRDMEKGRWLYTGEPIRFAIAEDGSEGLIDGQNRLLAIIESGTSQYFLVMRGFNREVQMVVDTGSSRTAADTLTMLGKDNGSALAATARLIHQVGLGPELFSSTKDQATITEVMALVDSNPRIEESLFAVLGINKAAKLLLPVAGASYFIGAIREPEMTALFFTRLHTGVDIPSVNAPVLALRNRLATGSKPTRYQQFYLTLRALNATRVERNMARMTLPYGRKVNGTNILNEVRNLTAEGAAPFVENAGDDDSE